MFTIIYTPHVTTPQPVNIVGSCVETSKRITINFVVLEDAFIAAGAVRKAGCMDVYVSNQQNPD